MPVRARDIRRTIMEMGFEKGVVHILELMAEENISTRQDMLTMAELQSTVVESLGELNVINDGMAKQINEMHRKEDQYAAVRSVDIPTDDRG